MPLSPLAGILGFEPLPALFWLATGSFVVLYLGIVEVVKRWLFRRDERPQPTRGDAEPPDGGVATGRVTPAG